MFLRVQCLYNSSNRLQMVDPRSLNSSMHYPSHKRISKIRPKKTTNLRRQPRNAPSNPSSSPMSDARLAMRPGLQSQTTSMCKSKLRDWIKEERKRRELKCIMKEERCQRLNILTWMSQQSQQLAKDLLKLLPQQDISTQIESHLEMD
jgi:hypothetical protein